MEGQEKKVVFVNNEPRAITRMQPLLQVMKMLRKSYKVIRDIYNENTRAFDNGRVLDIGCGLRGNFWAAPPDLYVGIDADSKVIKSLSARADGKYSLMKAQKLQFPDEYFDCVVSTSFFHHIRDEDAHVVSKGMARVLKDNGKAIIADGIYPISKFNIAGWLVRFFDRGRFVRNKTNFRNIFLKEFKIEKECCFTDKIFVYSVLIMTKKDEKLL